MLRKHVYIFYHLEIALWVTALVVDLYKTIRGGFLFFVSRRFASRIHEISDLKKALVLSLRAEYTRLKEKKNMLNTRGTRNGNRFRSCSREKGGQVSYLYILI